MASQTDRDGRLATRRGLLAGAAGLLGLLVSRRKRRSAAPGRLETDAPDGKPRRPDGRIPWIGHY